MGEYKQGESRKYKLWSEHVPDHTKTVPWRPTDIPWTGDPVFPPYQGEPKKPWVIPELPFLPPFPAEEIEKQKAKEKKKLDELMEQYYKKKKELEDKEKAEKEAKEKAKKKFKKPRKPRKKKVEPPPKHNDEIEEREV